MNWVAIISGFGAGAIVGTSGVGAAAFKTHLLAGSLPGTWLGAQWSNSMPDRPVRALLSGSLVAAGLQVIH